MHHRVLSPSDLNTHQEESRNFSQDFHLVSAFPRVQVRVFDMTSKKTWCDTEIRLLIAKYEEHSLLWDVNSFDYRNRLKKQQILQDIAIIFNTEPSEILRKIHNLRSQFLQELKKIKARKNSSGSDEYSYSTWPYFTALKFIQSSMNSTLNGDNHLESNMDPEDRETNKADDDHFEPNRKRKRGKEEEIARDIIQKALKLVRQPADEEQIFGDYVACELRLLKMPSNKRKLKRVISEAIVQTADCDAVEWDAQSAMLNQRYDHSLTSCGIPVPTVPPDRVFTDLEDF